MYSFAHTPLLRTIIPFIGGIISYIYIEPNKSFIGYSFCTFLCLYLTLIGFKHIDKSYRLRWIFGLTLSLTLFFGGASLTSYHFNSKHTWGSEANNTNIGLAKVYGTPVVSDKSAKVLITLEGIKKDSSWVRLNEKVILYIKKDSLINQLEIGDLILFKGEINAVPGPRTPMSLITRTTCLIIR